MKRGWPWPRGRLSIAGLTGQPKRLMRLDPGEPAVASLRCLGVVLNNEESMETVAEGAESKR